VDPFSAVPAEIQKQETIAPTRAYSKTSNKTKKKGKENPFAKKGFLD